MLAKICSVDSASELTAIGVELLKKEVRHELQTELHSKRFVFDEQDYWSKDKLSESTESVTKLEQTLKSCGEEEEHLNVLHRLQIICKWCPGARASIQRLLKKLTC